MTRFSPTSPSASLTPARIAHFWLVTQDETFRPGSSFFQRNLEQGFWSLFFLGQAMGEIGLKPLPHLTGRSPPAPRRCGRKPCPIRKRPRSLARPRDAARTAGPDGQPS
jgi:hypothetical protein